ncbi:hypothetical protein GIB67_029204 [Kingdonia uniflora]|uniref:Uncharacterized protein n=1 Tax=Kingdonia uniflora TaxID=39325 RepID=A0A7J7NAQ6_9MAGN|nr:hypothetical protein GIB67_029204 [Kingdonia uniflora]
MVESMVERYGHLDIMFSNAGIINPYRSIVEFDLSAANHLFGINVLGMVASVKHAARVTRSVAASSGLGFDIKVVVRTANDTVSGTFNV